MSVPLNGVPNSVMPWTLNDVALELITALKVPPSPGHTLPPEYVKSALVPSLETTSPCSVHPVGYVVLLARHGAVPPIDVPDWLSVK